MIMFVLLVLLIPIAMLAMIGLMWHRIAELRDRVDALEWAAAYPATASVLPVVTPSVPRSVKVPPTEVQPEVGPQVEADPLEVEVRQLWTPPPTSWTPERPTSEQPAYEEEPRYEPTPEPVRFNLEELFGRRLPVWAGGVTLAIAGFLIVKYSIDVGLLSPAVRILLGLLFGTALIGGAEAVRRLPTQVPDPRVAQALAGAGAATLYGSVLAAANLYHLIGPGLAFVGLAGVTALAGALALRFGAPSALIGLVGGLAAPALVGSTEPEVPLLSAYLALAVGGLCTLGRSRGWLWLGAAALTGGFGWGLMLILGGALDTGAALSLGVYTLLIAMVLPVALFSGGGERLILRLGAALVGCAQMAALVATGGFSPLGWALFGLISVAAVWLARREPEMRLLAPAALAVALLLAAAWPDPTAPMLAMVLAGAVAIFGGAAGWDLWRQRGNILHAIEIGALALATFLIPVLHFKPDRPDAALLALIGATLAATAAAMGWRVEARRDDARFALLVGIAGALTTIAGILLAPNWAAAPWAALVAAALLLLAHSADDSRIEGIAWSFGFLVLVALGLEGAARSDLERALGVGARSMDAYRAAAWAVPAAASLLFAVRGRLPLLPAVAEAVAPLLAYMALSQIVPTTWLPLTAAILLAMTALARSVPAQATAAAIAVGWTLAPLLGWGARCFAALLGEPVLVTMLPSMSDTALRIVPAALALALVAWTSRRRELLIVAAILGAAVLHIAFKQLFALQTPEDFIALGLAERTVWKALIGLAAMLIGQRAAAAARALGIASLAHFGWFTLVLHNPLWAAQAVGSLPVANLLLPAYGMALLLLYAAVRHPLGLREERERRWAVMAVITLFGLSTIRQLAHGTRLDIGAVGDAENIAYSLAGVVLALGFLRYGIQRSERDWRLGSLLLMLVAVAKVFLVDAAGLDGLARVASFAGLGFSLIGVGWLYSRYLPEPSRQGSTL